MERLTLEELVRQCQRTLPHDTRAFEQIVTAFKERVFATAYRILGNQQEAEDQTQEIFLKVYRNIKQLEDPATFSTWLYRITTNTCYDAITRQQRRPMTTPLTPPDPHESEELHYADTRTPTPEEAALRQELRRCMERTLGQLELTTRTVLVMRDIQDLSYQEIADVLNVGLSAAKMRIHRARIAFQQKLEQVCPGVWQTRSADQSVSEPVSM